MGAAGIGFSVKLETNEQAERAQRLVRKDEERYEIENQYEYGTYFWYIPPGEWASREQYNNGKSIATWVLRGEGNEPG